MTTIYFVRHAQPDYSNHDDESRGLTQKGLADRALVADFLADKGINAVLSSPYKRSYDTVKPLAQRLGLGIETVYDFRERKIDSEWIENFHAFSKKQWEDFSYKLSDGESFYEVQSRNIAALEQVLERFRDKIIAVGSHGTALSCIINYYDKTFGFAEFQAIKRLMPFVVRFDFEGKELLKIELIDLFDECRK